MPCSCFCSCFCAVLLPLLTRLCRAPGIISAFFPAHVCCACFCVVLLLLFLLLLVFLCQLICAQAKVWLNPTNEHLFTHHLTTHPLVSANHANEVVSTPSTLDVQSLCNNGAPGPNAFAFLANVHPDFCSPQTASKEHLSAHLLAKVQFCQGSDATTWHPSLSKTF